MTTKLTITRPDDWHLHLRDGAALKAVLPDTARQFARAIVMPICARPSPPRVCSSLSKAHSGCFTKGAEFQPLMTLYLTDNTSAEEIKAPKPADLFMALNFTQQVRRPIVIQA